MQKNNKLINRIKDRLLPVLEIPKIGEPLRERTKHLIIEGAGRLLPVPRDKRNRAALVDQLDDCLRLPGLYVQLMADRFYNIHSALPS